MDILQDAHLTFTSEGRLTLQIPEWEIDITKAGGAHLVRGVYNKVVSYPDDYFYRAKHCGYSQKDGMKYRAAVGREYEYGYLHLTRTGFMHFYNDLKASWNNQRGHTWQDFEDFAIKELDMAKQKTQEHLVRMQTELQLNNTPYNQKRVQQCQDALKNL